MRVRIIAAVWVAFSVLASAQQEDLRPTLPELARRFGPKPVYQSRIADFVVESLESVLPRADVIVHGTVDRVTTYLSPDQRDLYTDYLVRPLRMIPPRPPAVLARPGQTPVPPAPIVVTRWGGQTTINGVQVTQEDAEVSAFRVGDEVVLLLAYSKEEGKYRLPSLVSGVFLVDDSLLKPSGKSVGNHPIFDRVRGITVAQFESEVQRLSR
jgi:hypothetical protein